MKLDIKLGRLMTDEGNLIKRMGCPKQALWEEMKAEGSGERRTCGHCGTRVVDISRKSEMEVKTMVAEDSDVCFCIDLENTHIRVISNAS